MASIFTQIINKEIPAQVIYEDDLTIAFLDIRPVSPGHTLVVPKKEVDQFQDLDKKTYQATMDTVYKVAKILKDKLEPARIGTVIYGFDVLHVHVHVIPMDEPGAISMRHSDPVETKYLEAMKNKLVG
ncbi:MAG: HIT family protein [Candidatus Saccharimonadales bacterium]